MRDAMPALRAELGMELEVRIGLQSGEVVADVSTAVQGGIATDVFNTAARLQGAARPGSIVVGEETARLLTGGSGRVVLVPLDPLRLKGKTAHVTAFEVRELLPDAPSADRPLVGRDRQLEALRRALEDAVEAAAPVLMTILAPPGVGKSRLGRAFTADVERSATVLIGQTPAYGEGVTFAPLVEILTQASETTSGESAAVADLLRRRMADQPDGGTVADRLAQLLGVEESTGADTAWAVRRFLETLALERPLVLIVDDAHAAEEPMLDLLDAVVDRLHAPALVVCLARPELLESRPAWGGGKHRAATMSLPPLTSEESRALAVTLLGGDAPTSVVDQVCERSEGNPLYLEQLVAALEDQGLVEDGRWIGVPSGELEIPPTIQSLLAARLGRLDTETRRILELASVEGRRFHVDAVRALSTGSSGEEIQRTLEALESRGFVDPDDSIGAEWRFGHALIQEAAYRRLSKAGRAELHERLADWIEADRAAHPDADETVGRHLEVALGFRQELMLREQESSQLARRAGERFAAAGERAFARLDLTSSASLLQRAANLLRRIRRCDSSCCPGSGSR
jgi:predicted ATPase